jgi:tetratricopeptide (TPR) repeat protein
MSRSIHETHRQLRDVNREQHADLTKQRKAIGGIRQQLRIKQTIKRQVEVERRDAELPLQPSQVGLLPIHLLEMGPEIHYPASVTDLRNVMQALPKGVLDGLSVIELRLESNPKHHQGEPDPFLGRFGHEVLPGVYSAHALGTHYTDGTIGLSAYVYDPNGPHQEWLALYLRLQMLSTFVHEVAHRFDWTARRARGRWRMDNRHHNERYAKAFEHEWTKHVIVPYLERAYPHLLQALQVWVEHHGGSRVTVFDLAKSRDAHSEFFSRQRAFVSLVENVANAMPRNETRIEYARELHSAEAYDLALESLESILRDSPGEPEALILKADIKVHLCQFQAARQLAESVLHEDAIHLDALIVLSDALEGLRDWATLRTTSLRLCRLENILVYEYRNALLTLAKANLELGNLEFVRENLDELNTLEPPPQKTHAWDKLAWLKAELSRRTRKDHRRLKP